MDINQATDAIELQRDYAKNRRDLFAEGTESWKHWHTRMQTLSDVLMMIEPDEIVP